MDVVECLNFSEVNMNGKLQSQKITSTEMGIEDVATGMDFDEEIVHGMTASYTEISFNTQSSEPDDSVLEDLNDSVQEVEEFGNYKKKLDDGVERPNKLSLNSSDDTERTVAKIPLINRAAEFLNHLNGTVIQDGAMVSFVAEDLETKIKLSSPVSKSDDMMVWGSEVPWIYHRHVCADSPVIDSSIFHNLEIEVGKIATSVDSLTENLAGILHSMSALTVDCLETYRDVVCKTCDNVDLNIKSMYQLMAKCEELSKSMKPIYKLSDRIKEIKHFLEIFENSMN